MTEAQVIDLARASARELGYPWGREVAGLRRRVWPLPARWLVTAKDPKTGVTTRMVVDERTRAAWPSGVVYPRQGAGATAGRPGVRGPDLLRAAAGATAGALAAWVAGWPWWAGAALAIPGAMVGLLVLRPRAIHWPGGSHDGRSEGSGR